MINLPLLHSLVGTPEIVQLLISGVSGDDLSSAIQDHHPELTSPSLKSVFRMNLIGSLRGAGFKVSGGRQGGEKYQVFDWEKRTQTKVSWSPDQLQTLEWFEHLDLVGDDQIRTFRQSFSRSSTNPRHENCWLYYWGYELVGNLSNRATGRLFSSSSGGTMIIKRTFKDRPRFSLLPLSSTLSDLETVARRLSQVSFAPIKIVNPDPEDLPNLLEVVGGTVDRVAQPIYDASRIATSPGEFFSRQSWKTARKMLREVEFIEILPRSPRIADQDRIISVWKKTQMKSQARPATRRDSVLSESTYPFKMSILGYWRDVPVSYRVVEPLTTSTEVAADLLEKSINRSDDGGHSGISDASLVTICRYLVSHGIRFLNGGESSSVGPQLTQYKHKFQVHQTESLTVVSGFPHFRFQE